MNRTISFRTAVATASVSVCVAFAPAFAQEEAVEETPATEQVAGAKAEKAFYPLMRCVRTVGSVQVLRPRTTEWVAAREGRYYPLGSSVRVSGDEVGTNPLADFEFGANSRVVVTSAAEFATREIKLGEQSRVVELRAGRISLNLSPKLGEGMFKVVAPAFCCENLAGESVFDYSKESDGDEAVVRCVTGKFLLKGSHYQVPAMQAANQVRIRTTGDRLFTSIRGESGVCKVLLDQGLGTEKNFETGEVKDVPKTLEFALSPQCSIKIFRAKSAIGGRVAVSTMTFSPSGDMLNRFAFAEGRSNVNSGELVISPKIPESGKVEKAASDDDDGETVEAVPAEKAEKKADDAQPDKDEKADKEEEDI
ncbi:MAG: hypothetical protein ACI4RA_03585 [Kiritimatiellia bacterium]